MHAYMIIAHNQFELLEKLIKALDDERNDIFVHIDAKVKDFDFDRFKALTKYSRVVFTPERVNITWGDFSQVKCEMLLLKTAVENENKDKPYSYFHLLSGVDLPIKTNDYIHNFFEENNSKEFIHFTSEDTTVAESRIMYYHFFRKKRNTFYKIIAQVALRLQRVFGVNRLKKSGIKAQKGCNWFSITGDFAHYVYNHLNEYERIFRYSYCADEVFIQTVFINSPFADNLFLNDINNHYACVRHIDWNRGTPYVFRSEDYDELMNSKCFFARKFDLSVDSEIVDIIVESISN